MSVRRHLKNTFIAHADNNRRPHLYSGWGMVGVTLLLVLIATAPVVQRHIAQSEVGQSILAAVLPSALLDETNAVRVSNNLPVVAYSSHLSKAAQAKAEDMLLRQYFAHNSPEGLPPWKWLDDAGYSYMYAGENLAVHFTESLDVVRAWVASPKHYENLVKAEYTEMGLGIASGTLDGKQTTLVVQFFAMPAPVVPVAAEETLVQQVVREVTPVAEAVKDLQKAVERAAVAPEPAPVVVSREAATALAETVRTPRPVTQEVVPEVSPAQPQPVVLGLQAHELTFAEFAYDNVYELTILLLLAFLLTIAALYVVHHYTFRVHMPHVTYGSFSLGVVTLTLIAAVTYMHNRVELPTDTQSAQVSAVAKRL